MIDSSISLRDTRKSVQHNNFKHHYSATRYGDSPRIGFQAAVAVLLDASSVRYIIICTDRSLVRSHSLLFFWFLNLQRWKYPKQIFFLPIRYPIY